MAKMRFELDVPEKIMPLHLEVNKMTETFSGFVEMVKFHHKALEIHTNTINILMDKIDLLEGELKKEKEQRKIDKEHFFMLRRIVERLESKFEDMEMEKTWEKERQLG